MSRTIELAQQGCGCVEPNPMVGCVLVRDGAVVGEGWHQRFGGPHAEIEALAAAGDKAQGADAYVTLEPCCHQGKTGPCTESLISAGVARVIVGSEDPNPQVAGNGLAELRAAGMVVEVGVLAEQAAELIAPFAKLVTAGRPWVIAKWAMTLDGKLATRTGSSQWISGEASRAVVHAIRGRVDAILVGCGTVEADDPLLTARPPGPRTATRIVLDSSARLSPHSKLVQSVDQGPLLIAVSKDAPADRCQSLEACGAEILVLPGDDHAARTMALLDELGRRQMTNLLVEGGPKVFGALHDIGAVDEVHVFIAPKLVGGADAPSAIAGLGLAEMTTALCLRSPRIEVLGDDVYVTGRVERS
jgi:diaminohydroxyphosphoribosylaminopyrimidine deaminase/5-amino-6-(5-phosphoribosylamino)uracil reductase